MRVRLTHLHASLARLCVYDRDVSITSPIGRQHPFVKRCRALAQQREPGVVLLDGEHLVVVGRALDATGPEAALRALVAGPTPAEVAAGLGTEIPAETTVRWVEVAGDEITVDLSGPFELGGGSLSMFLRIGEVVFTATQFEGIDVVRFRIDGMPVDMIGGEQWNNLDRSDLNFGVRAGNGSQSGTAFGYSTMASTMPFAASASTCFCTSGVSTQPGQIALQVTPVCAVSSAITLVRPISPCLAVT